MKSLSDTLKDALAKKQEASHPDAKKSNQTTKKLAGNTAPKGPPQRKTTSRGG